MRRLACAFLAAVALCFADARAGSKEQLDSVRSFVLALGLGTGRIGESIETLGRHGLIVLDGEEATAEQVARLRAGGSIVMAYLSIGTIERGRSWYSKARPYRLEMWGDWGEYYAEAAAPGFRNLITRRVAPRMLLKGFDGLFLDNVDMIQVHPEQRAGMLLLVRSLRRLLQRDGRLLFAQNGDSVIGAFAALLDGWNREDVSFTYDFARRRYRAVGARGSAAAVRTLLRLRDRGILTTATDYTRAGSARADAASVARACAAGAIPFVSNIGLTRMPAAPFSCP